MKIRRATAKSLAIKLSKSFDAVKPEPGGALAQLVGQVSDTATLTTGIGTDGACGEESRRITNNPGGGSLFVRLFLRFLPLASADPRRA